MIALLLVSLAFAAPDVRVYPSRVDVSCPALDKGQVCRVEVPAEFVAAGEDCAMLVDASGQAVPYASLSTTARPGDWRALRLRGPASPGVIPLNLDRDRPVAAIRVLFHDGGPLLAVRVQTRRAGEPDWRSGPWASPDYAGAGSVDVLVPDAGADEARLVFDRPFRRNALLAMLLAGGWDAETLEPTRLDAALTALPAGLGHSAWRLDLPGARRVIGLNLMVEGDIFHRAASLLREEFSDGELRPSVITSGTLERVLIGETHVDRTALYGFETTGDALRLEVEDGPNKALAIRSAQVLVARTVLLVRDSGPMTLYGGLSAPTPAYDLQTARAELSRAPSVNAVVGQAAPNPEWSGGVAGAELLAPGAPIARERFLRSRRLDGQGLVRVELPAEVLAVATDDLRDLRVLDAEGRQIPYVIARDDLEHRISDVTVEVAEETGHTTMRVSVPTPGLPIRHISLMSDAGPFSREVAVYVEEEGREILGDSARWIATEPGANRLTLSPASRLWSALRIEIKHGDDHPIPARLEGVWVSGTALLLRLPPGGAELVYGDAALERRSHRRRSVLRDRPPLIQPPQYDLPMLVAALQRAHPTAMSPGEPSDIGPPPGSSGDRVIILGALAFMAAGLLLVLRRVLASPESPSQA